MGTDETVNIVADVPSTAPVSAPPLEDGRKTLNWDKVFDVVINKLHIVLGAAAQGAILFYHFHTGRDIGPGVQGTVYAYYGFLLGHAGVYQFKPDSPNGG